MGSVNELEQKSLFRKEEEDATQAKAASLMEQGSLSLSFPEHATKSPKNSVLRSIKIVIFSNKLNMLLPFGPLAILVHYMIDSKVSVLILVVLFHVVRVEPQEMIVSLGSGVGFLAELNWHYTIG